jgi:hypothetical protein
LYCAVSSPLINIENSVDLTFTKVCALAPTAQFYGVNGGRSRGIRVDSVGSSSVRFGYGAEKGAVSVGR